MRKVFAIVRDTFRELLVRKVLIGFAAVNVLALIGIALYVEGNTVVAAMQRMNLPDTPQVRHGVAAMVEVGVASFFQGLLLFVSIFATASVLPTVLEKGTIDLYLSKPISRSMLLFGKVLGSVLVIAANIAMFMGGAWVILSLRLGFWNTGFLAAAPTILFSFVTLYAIVVLFNVVTRKGTLGIIITYVHFIALSGVLANREKIAIISDNAVMKSLAAGLYYILPQTFEINGMATMFIAQQPVASWTPMITSAALAAVTFGLAGWLFNRKEF